MSCPESEEGTGTSFVWINNSDEDAKKMMSRGKDSKVG
jgi:hypothetical protein